MLKRLFDILFSAIGLLALSPVFAAAAFFIRHESDGPIFFRQERVGKDFRPFRIYKFRTMVADGEKKGPLITVGGDSRVTKVGRFLRKYKIDELPQLLNVLKGEMSLVGPRPEVVKYVRLFNSEYSRLLRVRPGITDPASIKYSEEERALSSAINWEDDYVNRILPEKIRLSLRYTENCSVLDDFKLILRTIFKIADPG